MVRLKRKSKLYIIRLDSSLNSTMVRLKLFKTYHTGFQNAKSQFHYGSIKTLLDKQSQFSISASQFHYGSIKTSKYRLI